MPKWFDSLEGATGRSVLSLPGSLLRVLSGGTKKNDEGAALNPAIQMGLLLARIHKATEDLEPPRARSELARLTGFFDLPAEPLARVENLSIPGLQGHRIPVRLYSALRDNRMRSAMIYFHGGGFVIGDLNSNDAMLRSVAARSGLSIVSVDYRLAPESPYPAGAEDAWAAYQWFQKHGNELGLNPGSMGVGGDSAGGNLAIHVSLMAKKKRIRSPEFQALIYPWVDLGDSAIADSSMIELASGYGLTGAMLDYFRRHSFQTGTNFDDPMLSPVKASRSALKALPPTLIQLCGFDPLRDQGRRFGALIQEAGGEVNIKNYDSLIHGSISLAGTIKEARSMIDDLAQFLEVWV